MRLSVRKKKEEAFLSSVLRKTSLEFSLHRVDQLDSPFCFVFFVLFFFVLFFFVFVFVCLFFFFFFVRFGSF